MGRKSSGKPLVHRCKKKQKNGSVYVYERIRILNSEKGGYDETRRLLGILPPGSEDLYGELLPTRPKRKKLEKLDSIHAIDGIDCSKNRTGMIDIIRFISEKSKIDHILSSSFPDEEGLVQKILTCAWYCFATDGDTWPGIVNWSTRYQGILPYSASPISKDMYHELFVELGRREDIRFQLFRKMGAYLKEKESMLALDSSTFDTESDSLAGARKAPHKDGQIKKVYKIVFFYAMNLRKPVAYSLIPGNIPDSQTVENALKQVEGLNIKDMEIVSDNGYYTAASAVVYLKREQAFLTRIEASIKWISELIEDRREELERGGNILKCDPKFSGCKVTVNHTFQHQTTVGGKKKTESISADINVFLYFSSVNKAKDDVYFRTTYHNIREDLLCGRYLGKERKKILGFADKYMLLEYDENGNVIHIEPKMDACRKALQYSGYLVLLSNKETDVNTALEHFRKREYIEEDIKNYKSHANGRKPRVWHDDTLDGEILVQFLALILHETYELSIKKMKAGLAMLDGDPEHDCPEVLDTERQLLNFLNKTSLHDQLQWFDAIVTRRYMKENSGTYWETITETTKRDNLYLKMLGIKNDDI